MKWTDFIRKQTGSAVTQSGHHSGTLVAEFNSLDAEYKALIEGAGIVDRNYRKMLEVQGKDRAGWLHNLTTNTVRTLQSNEGNYAFAVNMQGRILLDLIVMIREERIWLNIDQRFIPKALEHFGKYIVTEDVTLNDRSEDFVQMALCGPEMHAILQELGVQNSVAMPQFYLIDVQWQGGTIGMFRHDFCGVPAAEFILPDQDAIGFWEWATNAARGRRLIPIGDEAVQVRRIESGIPWPGHEITEKHLPAETRQLERAVSFQKGCYLGQEIVERMRSRNVVANLLCALRLSGTDVPPQHSQIVAEDGTHIGFVTSACRSLASGGIAALGYVKSATMKAEAKVTVVEGATHVWKGTLEDTPVLWH